jgi:O-antigen/teichoic acid export membrane protein
MHYFFPIAIVLTICSKWIFIAAFSSAFEESGKLFAALLLLTIPRLVFPQTILTALQKNKWILFASISEMLVNIIASILLAKQFGLIGVAYGTVVAFVFEKLLLTIILYKEEKIKPQQYIPLRTLFIYSLLLVLSFAASTLILN